MANMLRRVCHFLVALAVACLSGGLNAQEKAESDEVRRKAMESRLVQIDKQVGELQAKLDSEYKTRPPFLMMCGNDIPRMQNWMDETTARLKMLEGSEAHVSEAKKLKEDLETHRKAVESMLVQIERIEEAARRITAVERQRTDLLAERELLALDLKSMWR